MVCGVFQGSVFITLSFHISINDLDSCIKYPQVYQFAENNFLRYFAGNTSKYLSMQLKTNKQTSFASETKFKVSQHF